MTISMSRSSAASARRGSTPGNANKIRLRLLNKLGIYDDPASSKDYHHHHHHNPNPNPNRHHLTSNSIPTPTHSSRDLKNPINNGVMPFQVPLKYADSNSSLASLSSSPPNHLSSPSTSTTTSTTAASSSASPSSSSSSSRRKSKIAFSNQVSVLPIPMRHDYSTRMKNRLWNDRFELHENIARNTVEFAAEGWNWRTVTEDDGMYVCSVSGALIHPVHCQQRRYVPMMMEQQQQQQQKHPRHSLQRRKHQGALKQKRIN